MANGKFVWTPAGGAQQSYIFPVNYSWGYQVEHQDFGDRERALDGTLRSYQRGLKQRWVLEFNFIDKTQRDQLWEIKQAAVDLDFYEDADGDLTGTFQWVGNFNFARSHPQYYTGSIELEEV